MLKLEQWKNTYLDMEMEIECLKQDQMNLTNDNITVFLLHSRIRN